jgi:hypothetical protein
MTSDGSPYTRFQRALNSGNLHLIRTAALELPRGVPLSDALRIVYLLRDDEARYERACLRWVARFCLECQDVTLEQVERAAGALRELLWNADEATRTLSELCARNGIQHARVDGGRD